MSNPQFTHDNQDIDALWGALPSLAGRTFNFTSTAARFTEIKISCSDCGFETTELRGYASLVKEHRSYRDEGRDEHWEVDVYGWCIRCWPYKLLHAQVELWPDMTMRRRQPDGSIHVWETEKVKQTWREKIVATIAWLGRLYIQ